MPECLHADLQIVRQKFSTKVFVTITTTVRF